MGDWVCYGLPGGVMFVVRLGAALVLLELATVTVAWACTCSDTPALEDLVVNGDPVVLATIGGTRPWESSGGCGGGGEKSPSHVHYQTIDVTEVIAGDADLGEIEVRVDDRSTCSLSVQEGEVWILQMGNALSYCSANARVSGPDDPIVVELREAAAAE